MTTPQNTFDVKTLNPAQLATLQAAINATKPQAAKEAMRNTMATIKTAIAENGVDVKDVIKELRATRKAAPVKFVNPADSTQTWSGKGRKPFFFKEAEESGVDMDTWLA